MQGLLSDSLASVYVCIRVCQSFPFPLPVSLKKKLGFTYHCNNVREYGGGGEGGGQTAVFQLFSKVYLSSLVQAQLSVNLPNFLFGL